MSQQFTVIEICTEITKLLLKNNFDALRSNFTGTSYPLAPIGGQFFINTTVEPWVISIYNDELLEWVPFTAIDSSGEPLSAFILALINSGDIAEGSALIGHRGETLLAYLDGVQNYLDSIIGFVRRFADGGETINLNGLTAVIATKSDDVALTVTVSDSSGKLIDGLAQYEIFGYNDTVFFLLNGAGTEWISKS